MTRTEIKFVSYFAEHSLPLNTFDNFKVTLKDAVSDSQIIQTMTPEKTKATYITKISLIIDEKTDTSKP